MSKFFKSRFFIIALLVSVVLTVVPSVLSFMGLQSYVRNAVNTVATPFRYCITKVSDSIEGFILYFRRFDDLNAENKILKDKIKELQGQLYEAELAKEENEWLYNYLGMKREHMDYELEGATVVGRESGNYMTILTLNRGTMHGIAVDMPVITDDGIVGYVGEVGLTWCKVITILETASSVGAYVERSGELGLVEGVYELKGNGVCRMSYLVSDADIKVGDKIVSSGIGSIYPRGLIIGTVSALVPDEISRELVATIEPAADFSDLVDVMILKGFVAYTGEGSEVNE